VGENGNLKVQISLSSLLKPFVALVVKKVVVPKASLRDKFQTSFFPIIPNQIIILPAF
jgi:hypothetical protein